MSPQISPRSTAASDPFRQDILALIPHLRNFARSLCGDRELAEDLMQGALASAWRARDGFRTGTNLKAWLFTILRNDFYSYRRRSWRQMNWDETKAERLATPDDPQYWALELSDATRGLNELPASQREALILVGAGGLSYEEAAALRGVPLGTVKSRVARGRLALADLMSGERKFEQPALHSNPSTDIPAQLMALMSGSAPRAAFT